jgi:hypothetical protein
LAETVFLIVSKIILCKECYLMKRLVPVVLALSSTILLVSIAMAQTRVDFHVSDSPDGPAMTLFPSGTTVVYAVFNCTDEIRGEQMIVKVKGDYGTVLFEQAQTCTGSETKSVAAVPDDGVFPDGRYLTNLYRGEFLAASAILDVGEPVAMPVATPTTTSPVARVYSQVKGFAVPAAAIVLIILGVWTIYRVLTAR